MASTPIERIRALAVNEEIDYPLLQAALRDYAAPRDVVTRLLERGELIRVKKGLYVFGERYQRRLISLEVLANQIYGPSYVSREYMLQYYGFIPEGVMEVTSMTSKKNKNYSTPLGRFTYRYLAPAKFSVGINLLKFSETHSALVASPEKALADYIYMRKEKIKDLSEFKAVLLEDYRLDEERLADCNLTTMKKISQLYKNDKINLLLYIIDDLKNA